MDGEDDSTGFCVLLRDKQQHKQATVKNDDKTYVHPASLPLPWYAELNFSETGLFFCPGDNYI